MAAASAGAGQASFLSDGSAAQASAAVKLQQQHQQPPQQSAALDARSQLQQQTKHFQPGLQAIQPQFISSNDVVQSLQSVQKPLQQFQTAVGVDRKNGPMPYQMMQKARAGVLQPTRRFRLIKRPANGMNFVSGNSNSSSCSSGNSGNSNDSDGTISATRLKEISLPQSFKLRANVAPGWRRQLCDGEIVYFR